MIEINILEISLFLREHPHIKVSVLVGLKGGGDDEVFSRWKAEVVAHFSQVDEGLGACF